MVKIISVCLFLGLGLWGCDDGGGFHDMAVIRPCITREDLPSLTCLAPDIIAPPGLCEPLDCESETMSFNLPLDDPQIICQTPDDCTTITCDRGNLIFSDSMINPDGNLEGTINKDGQSESFVCF
jgi:hypothetical protein